MPRCAAPAALGFALLALSAGAQETADPPRSELRSYMRDAIKDKVQAKPAKQSASPTESAAGDAVKMAPFVVQEDHAPKLAGIDDTMRKEKALESHALYHTELSKKLRMEVGLPPRPGGKGGFALPLFRLSW